MIIGIDIDDTVANSRREFIRLARKFNSKNKIIHNIDTRQLDQKLAFGWNKTYQQMFMKENLKHVYKNAKPKKNASKVISDLKNQGHKIIFISARENKFIKDAYDISYNWLKLNEFNFDKLIICKNKKSNICKKHKINIFIDDNLNNCEDVYKNTEAHVYNIHSVYYNNNNPQIKNIYSWTNFNQKLNGEIYE